MRWCDLQENLNCGLVCGMWDLGWHLVVRSAGCFAGTGEECLGCGMEESLCERGTYFGGSILQWYDQKVFSSLGWMNEKRLCRKSRKQKKKHFKTSQKPFGCHNSQIE